MSPRTGRPVIGSPKTFEVKARIDKETNDKLEIYCKEKKVSKTDVVRLGLSKVLNEK